MKASNQYKTRLMGLLDKATLKKELGFNPSSRKLQSRAGNLISHAVIVNWQNGRIGDELDVVGLSALSKILNHHGYQPHELSFYLKNGRWLDRESSETLKDLWDKRESVNEEIRTFVVA